MLFNMIINIMFYTPTVSVIIYCSIFVIVCHLEFYYMDL